MRTLSGGRAISAEGVADLGPPSRFGLNETEPGMLPRRHRSGEDPVVPAMMLDSPAFMVLSLCSLQSWF